MEFDFSQRDDESCKVILRKNGKKLIFREFWFGNYKPDLDIVMDSIKDDYRLLKSSPSLSAYIENRGMVEDISLDYDMLRIDVRSMVEFFGKEYLENLISE